MEVGVQIMLLRDAKGISREQMADKLGIHINTYKNIEYGKKIPDLKEIEKIAEILEIEPSMFLSSKGSTFINNVHNSPGTGVGNYIVNDRDLIFSLTKAMEKLGDAIDRLKN